MRLSRLRIRQQMRAGQPSAKVLYGYLEHPENFLWTILVGNTVANFLILGWLVARLHEALGEHRVWFVVVFSVAVFLFYAFFDLLPKMLFRMYPNRLCVLLARPFRFIHLALRPLVALVEAFSGALLRLAGRQSLHRAPVRQPRGAAAGDAGIGAGVHLGRADDDQSRARFADADRAPGDEAAGPGGRHDRRRRPSARRWRCAGSGSSPACRCGRPRDGQQRIVGMLALNTLLYQPALDATRPVGEYVKPALFLDEDLRLEVALRRLQRSGQRLAIVLGRERREIGILSLQDVLKAIFGEVSL